MKVMKPLTIVIAVLLSVSLFAQTQIGLNGVGGKIGYVDPEGGIESTIGFGVVADLGTITPKIAFEADIFYWGKSYDFGFGSDVKFSSFTISALGKYLFAESKEQLRPYAGAGLGLAIGKSKVEYTDPWTGSKASESDSDSDIVIHLCGGTKYRLSPQLDGFAELRYTLGDLDVLSILVGAIYSLK
ncbi:MAG TPA: porin family protein [bacterium]|nr:porin family protein [bacterium]